MRQPASQLARFLASAARGLYLVDDDCRLVYLNAALAELLGMSGEDLRGRICRYAAPPQWGDDLPPPDPAGLLADALCPPPAALSGTPLWQPVVIPCGPAAGLELSIFFCPLASEEPTSVLALVVQAGRLIEGNPAIAGDTLDAAQLHALVQRFRADAARRYDAAALVGSSATIARVRAQVELAAATRAAVTLVGPPGSGRRHVAATIHYRQAGREGGGLVTLDCGLLDDESFVEALGVFASEPRVAGAGPGSVVLAEVDQLSPLAQRELARQSGLPRWSRRLLATAREPLDALAARGAFEPELACRLATLVIQLPPLAARRSDLPLLAQTLLERINAVQPKQLGGLTPEALDKLALYDWPGNLDELAEVLAQMHAAADGPYATARDVPQRVALGLERAGARRRDERIALDRVLADVERELIQRALRLARGNKAKAARLLGLTRPRLYRRLVHLGLEDADEPQP